jgi:hypothetical protein
MSGTTPNSLGIKPKKKVPWEGFWGTERHAEAWEREQKVQGRMNELEAELDEITAFGSWKQTD